MEEESLDRKEKYRKVPSALSGERKIHDKKQGRNTISTEGSRIREGKESKLI